MDESSKQEETLRHDRIILQLMERSPLELLEAILDCPEMYLVSPNTRMLKEEIRRVLNAERETREAIKQLTQEAA